MQNHDAINMQLFDTDRSLLIHVGEHEGDVGSEQVVHFVAE